MWRIIKVALWIVLLTVVCWNVCVAQVYGVHAFCNNFAPHTNINTPIQLCSCISYSLLVCRLPRVRCFSEKYIYISRTKYRYACASRTCARIVNWWTTSFNLCCSCVLCTTAVVKELREWRQRSPLRAWEHNGAYVRSTHPNRTNVRLCGLCFTAVVRACVAACAVIAIGEAYSQQLDCGRCQCLCVCFCGAHA